MWTKQVSKIPWFTLEREPGKPWISIIVFISGVELTVWYPGYRLSPTRTWHKSVEEAKAAGEAIIKGRL